MQICRYQRVRIYEYKFLPSSGERWIRKLFYSHFTGVWNRTAYDRHTVSFVLFCLCFFRSFGSVQFSSDRLCFVLFYSVDLDYTLCSLPMCVCWSCAHYHSALLFSPTHIIAGCLHERSVRFEECVFMLLVVVDIVARILHATHACVPNAHNCLRWKRHVR